MQLLQSILILSVCLAGIYVLPATLANASLAENELYGKILRQMHATPYIDTRALTPGEVACADDYNNATAAINNRLLNQTNACFENANKTTNTNNVNVNKTVTTARQHMLNAQRQIINCTELTDNGMFVNCTTATFDYNLQQLNQANTVAYQAQSEAVMNQNQVVLVREACIDAALGGAKTNMTLATNEYSLCLKNLKYDRFLAIEAKTIN